MKIIIENHIPYIQGLLEPVAQVEYLPNAQITPAAVRDAQVLLVRTRTQCNRELLQGSAVQFIGTATIGTDHIDLDYCAQHGITVASAPGCNAPAVAQWVHSTIGHWMRHRGIAGPQGLTLGIVGVGHVGSIVARWAQQLGYRTLLCDPPRASREGGEGFATLQQVQREAHIITFHTPLDATTRLLCDEKFLDGLQCCKLVMNAARGAIASNTALQHWHGDVAIDCWEKEPAISLPLLERAFVATPHIAGYSADGKHRGTAMVIEALNCRYGWQVQPAAAQAPLRGAEHVTLQQIMASYNPLLDTAALRSNPTQFEQLRNHYNLRPEVM